MRRVLEERPWLVIAAWIIIVLVAASYAARIDEVVQTSQEEFLPPTAESVRAMERLAEEMPRSGEIAGSPDFMIVVHQVPIDLETYYKVKDWYIQDYRSMAPAAPYSWIDITWQAEDGIRQGMKQALNGSITALQGIAALSAAYNETLDRVNMTAMLIQVADSLYASMYQLGASLQEAVPGLQGLQQALYQACYNITPALAYTYYDVTRAEGLLEALTQAYQRGYLTSEDLARVVEASDRPPRGPLGPGLVAAVFNYTLQLGGPSGWSNEAGARLAKALLNSTMPQEAQPLLEASYRAWAQVVANDTSHKDIVYRSPGTGQDLLLDRVNRLLDTSRELAAVEALKTLTGGMPEDQAALARLVGLNTIKSGCKPELFQEILVDSLAEFLEGTGLHPEAARVIAVKAASGNFTSLDAAVIAVGLIKREAPVNASIIDTMPDVLVSHDPNATGTLQGREAVRVAALLIAQAMGAGAGELGQVGGLEEAAYRIMKLAVGGGPEAGLLDELWKEGLLGRGPREVAQGSIDMLVERIASTGNLTREGARAIAEAAVRVYTGSSTIGEEVEALARAKLEEVFPSIVERLRGVMVEKGLQGFIVVLTPSGDGLEERIAAANESAMLLESGLEAFGYKPETALGGQAVMEYEVREAAIRDVERSDRLSVVFVIIILALVLESIAAVFLPFIGIGFGIVVSLAGAYILAKQGMIDITTQSRTIMFTTGLGLGVDYAAYVAKRFREAMQEGLEPRRAAAEAYARSRRPVIAGALTASIGFGSMMLARDFPFIASIGSNVPLTILAVMLASITFIPALLAYVGSKRWFWWPKQPGAGTGSYRLHPLGRLVSSKPLAFIALVAVVTLLSAWVAAGFEGSYDLALNLPPDTGSRRALEMINTYYDPGTLYPVYVVASSPEKAQEVAKALTGLDCVARAGQVGNTSIVRVIMAVNPVSSEGVECAEQVREAAHSVDPESLVGGLPAMNLDFRNLINDVFYNRVYPVALVLMFLTMLVAYGGVLTAAAAVLSVGLAALWGSSLTVLLYQEVLGEEVIWYLPVIVFTAILGVGMDYNSFYLARAREECMRECSIDSVAWSIAKGTPIVLGLSAIMAGAYLGLTLASSPGLSQMGMALVLGVLAAGLNASLVLTPPVIALLGHVAWWPSARR